MLYETLRMFPEVGSGHKDSIFSITDHGGGLRCLAFPNTVLKILLSSLGMEQVRQLHSESLQGVKSLLMSSDFITIVRVAMHSSRCRIYNKSHSEVLG